MGSRKESSKVTGEKAALDMLYSTSIGACVDNHVQDQLIIFMALAKGKSRVRTPPLTLHTKTAIYISELMTKVRQFRFNLTFIRLNFKFLGKIQRY